MLCALQLDATMLLQCRAAHQCRIFSRGLASYSPKVRAFPFKVSPSEAILQLSLTSAGVEAFSTRLDSPPKPTKIVPVYFPAWFVDGEIEARVALSNVKGYITAIFHNSYLPGHTGLDKISAISLLSDSLALTEAVPFTTELATQWDTEITCLPFRTTPFPVLDSATSLTFDQCRVNEIFALDPSSIKANLICAYPVLIPLYLAQYTANKTVVLEAHHEEGRILEERGPNEAPFQKEKSRELYHKVLRQVMGLPPPRPSDGFALRFLRFLEQGAQATESKIDELEAALEGLFVYLRGSPTQFVNIAALTISPTLWKWNYVHLRDFQRWLDGFRTTGTLPAASSDTMVDPRVRPFTADEVLAVRNFLKAGQERAKTYTLLDSIPNAEATTPEGRQILKEYAASLDAFREKAIPSWWKEWQNKSTKQ
ncbi:hypothetical protein B0H12DRAFT_1088542 [Mycena haematopus]|nr:hypothetical protein B0H12DRAFT_1088542 [Mycena haematopus]